MKRKIQPVKIYWETMKVVLGVDVIAQCQHQKFGTSNDEPERLEKTKTNNNP